MNFYYASLIAFHQPEELPYLKRYLNIILNLSPPLAEDSVFDQQTAQAIIEVKKISNKTFTYEMVVDETITFSLWNTINNLLNRIKGWQWLLNEYKIIPLRIYDLLNGKIFPLYTDEMKACDQKLAKIFGGEGAVVATIFDPFELRFPDGSLDSLAGKPRSHGHSAVPANEMIGQIDRGGIIHLYANEQGLAGNVGVYVPVGFKRLREIKDVNGKLVPAISGKNNLLIYYSKERNLYICYAHVETKKVTGIGTKNKYGSIKIGNIGGPGGKSPFSDSNGKFLGYKYFHVHIAFYSEFYNDVFTGTRTDPRDYFCK